MLPDFDLLAREYVYVEETRTAHRMFLRSKPLRVEIHSGQNGHKAVETLLDFAEILTQHAVRVNYA